MRRAFAILLLLFVGASFLAPAAMAAIAQPSHACCMRRAHHGCNTPQAGFTAKSECNQHCPCALTVSQSSVKPEPAWAAPTPANAHPVLDEFFPVAAPASQPGITAQRAPPQTSSR